MIQNKVECGNLKKLKIKGFMYFLNGKKIDFKNSNENKEKEIWINLFI